MNTDRVAQGNLWDSRAGTAEGMEVAVRTDHGSSIRAVRPVRCAFVTRHAHECERRVGKHFVRVQLFRSTRYSGKKESVGRKELVTNIYHDSTKYCRHYPTNKCDNY